MLNINRTVGAIILISFSIFIFVQCVSKLDTSQKDIRGARYAGAASCKACHLDVYNDFIQTAHFNTSDENPGDMVQAGFEKGKNVFDFTDSVKVVMSKVHDRYYQTEYRSEHPVVSHSFDIAIGSGRKAQTFLYYDSNKIFQLPISWFASEHSWANSPGFPANEARFDRPIPSTCFGCHSSFIATESTYEGMQLKESFQKGRMIYGIDCERCHGPAADHVAFHTDHPEEKQSKFLTSIRPLTRNQKTDMCALCHSGLKVEQQSLFGFKPGDKLSDFYYPDFNKRDAESLDVHANQAQLMQSSKCYLLSNDLSCNSCHNVHVKERDNIALFSQRCITCHKEVNHRFAGTMKNADAVIRNNCIDCHMPLQASKAITMLTKQQTSAKPDLIRTHLIKVYLKESNRFIDSAGRITTPF